MWLFTRHAFLSIIQHRDQPDMLMVRARVKGDIEHYFPDASVIRLDDADYLYRAVIPRKAVVAVMAKAVEQIDYDKFKPAVEDKRREVYYFSVWDIGYLMQEDLSQEDNHSH
jgi:hypothetical protein